MSSIQTTDEQNGGGTAGSPRPRVVLAEDHEDTRRVYGLILRHFGYDVIDATTGDDAVARTRALHPDLVLMDIGLPGMDGWQASRILKSDASTNRIPIVAFSARINSTDDLVAGSDTFDGFILKPISPTGLVRRVDAFLNRQRPATDPTPIFISAYDPPSPSENAK
jgi:two-component system cell cycle response regulator DivK